MTLENKELQMRQEVISVLKFVWNRRYEVIRIFIGSVGTHKNRVVDSHSTMIQSSSKPIPIRPPQTKHYDAATWRMYELITAARIRAASDNLAVYYKAVDLNREDRSDATTRLQLQRQRRAYSLPERPSTASPISSSLTDGVFTMDSL